MTDVAAPVFKKRTNKGNLRKRPATPPSDGSSTEASDYTDDEHEPGKKVKRRRKEGINVGNSVQSRAAPDLSKSTAYEADRTAVFAANDDATKTSHWYTEVSNAAEVARATARAQREMRDEAEATGGDGTYKGTGTYSNFIQKNPDQASKQVGPVKAPTNVRMITVTDFAPDVCKDYKQTGFCGFGDSCKFLHAREDYAQGWQLDKEWESAGKKAKTAAGKDATNESLSAEDRLLESIPFKCIICKSAYKRPVMTRCGHYFCEKCAMMRYMKDKQKTCANCGADTHGTFNTAKKLNDILEKKRKRIAERKAEAREAGEDVLSDDDGDDKDNVATEKQ